jgi:transglutaminase-like putative cysteine protease
VGAAPPKVDALSDKERDAALVALGDIDYKSESFQSWLTDQKLRRDKDESDLDFARRTFLAIRSGFRYEYRADMDRRVSAVCKAGRSDCGGLAALFVATMRANRVPARTLFGRWAKSANAGETVGDSAYYQSHVKAEFFAEGIGWVPVDVASSIGLDKTKDGLSFFGNDRGDFLTFHVDTGLEVDTRTFGRQKVPYLQVPAYWFTGAGSGDGRTVKEDWVVKKLP